jgi:predicted GTPase
MAGTTRDRRERIGRLGDITFRLVDMAGVDGEKLGFAFGKSSHLYEMVSRNDAV